jgi:hypothetical protein
MTGNP